MANEASTKPSGTVTELGKSGSALTASMRKSLSPLRVHSLSAIGFSGAEGASATVLFSGSVLRPGTFCETKLLSEAVFFSDFEFASGDGLSFDAALFSGTRLFPTPFAGIGVQQ